MNYWDSNLESITGKKMLKYANTPNIWKELLKINCIGFEIWLQFFKTKVQYLLTFLHESLIEMKNFNFNYFKNVKSNFENKIKC